MKFGISDKLKRAAIKTLEEANTKEENIEIKNLGVKGFFLTQSSRKDNFIYLGKLIFQEKDYFICTK